MWGFGGHSSKFEGAKNADDPPLTGRANQRTRRGEGSLVVTVQVVAKRLWSIPRQLPWRPQRERRQSSRTSCLRVGSGHGFPCFARAVARRVTRVRNVRRNYRQQAYWWHPYGASLVKGALTINSTGQNRCESQVKSLIHRIVQTSAPAATTLIRLLVGGTFLSEGIQKFLYLERGTGRFMKIGLPNPEFLGPFVASFETLCGALILLGFFTRLATVPLLVIMTVAVTTTKVPILLEEGFWKAAHDSRNDWSVTLGSLFLLIVGAGPWSLDKRIADRIARAD